MWFAGLAVLLVGCGFSVPANGSAGGDGGIDAPADMPGGISSPRKVVLDTTGLTTELDDVPVLIPIAGQVEYSQILDPRKDLRFEDPATGATLAYEVESWNPLGESLVWVEVPKLRPPPAPAELLLHFGRDAGNDDPAGVWSSYEQVTHFAGSPIDSTGRGHDGTATGATVVSGQLGSAMGFTGSSDRVVFAGEVLDQWEQGTLEMWIRPGYANGPALIGTQPRVIENGGALLLGRFYDDLGTLVMQIDMKWSGASDYGHPAVPGNTWTYLVWSYDGQALRVYRDGQQVHLDSLGAHAFANSGALVLGDGASNAAKMQIDELRVSQKGMSADWIRIQHRAMSRSFVTFSDP